MRNDQQSPKAEPTQRYSQALAAYTLRQFSIANSQLDEKNKSKLAKLPGSYSRVVNAERLSSVLGSGNRIRA
ncbi:hypothetical protein CC1G_03216 [Coprinopsis cinerea okayama7|uniref:Uncharacterized protein n=1 Tax=Coprinopsis cinerea (strain Okayama-7 / 130 / ATCC MYA-4618 / FGSC 9003) TaxID=240176 RepID=A8N773_COPC7|nr:hypothetical protein CC1G_03216 [Coprinopsis cinerea okayama7\|eukprot:XP_001830679.1 hypothetical protein CC1G_03216 [Coprinopsis cinerea okayama7\